MTAIEYHNILMAGFDQCYSTGHYTGLDCESCPNKNDCSGHNNHDENDDNK